jgi:flagellar biosynthesis protein FlhB
MAEAYEKTEAPTPRRRAAARRDGHVARSGDLVAAAVVLAALVLLQTTGPKLLAAFRELLKAALSQPATAMTTADVANFTKSLSLALLPLFVGVILVALAANLLQFGFLLRWPARFDALDMSKGWERLFSPRSRVRLLMDLIKIALVAWLASSLLRQLFGRIVALQQVDAATAMTSGAGIALGAALRIAVLLLTLGVLDYAYQRWQHERDLRMTRREIKDELRQAEGDPQIKRIRRGGLFALTNPTQQGGNK